MSEKTTALVEKTTPSSPRGPLRRAAVVSALAAGAALAGIGTAAADTSLGIAIIGTHVGVDLPTHGPAAVHLRAAALPRTYITGNGVNVRATPGTGSVILGKAYYGTGFSPECFVGDPTGHGYWYRGYVWNVATGWVNSAYVHVGDPLDPAKHVC